MRKSSLAEAKKALGDLIVQLKIICGRLGLDFKEVEEFGFWHFMEWLDEIAERTASAD